jgi:hypothetical protein
MKPRELFAVAVKSVGLYFIVQGIYRLLQIVDVVLPLVTTEARLDPQNRLRVGMYIFAAFLHFAISALFLRGTDWFVRLGFPPVAARGEAPSDENRVA